MSDQTAEFFDTLSKILLRCWVFGFALLFLWLGALLSGAVHNLHGPLMGLSAHELDVIHYCGIAFLKLLVICFFFFPWLSIRLVLRKAKASK
jgi:hypothetical protein